MKDADVDRLVREIFTNWRLDDRKTTGWDTAVINGYLDRMRDELLFRLRRERE
jgi:hypothetical protein